VVGAPNGAFAVDILCERFRRFGLTSIGHNGAAISSASTVSDRANGSGGLALYGLA